MKSFIRTVDAGSFTVVARELGTTQPTVSKQIAALEDYLGVQLLTRTTRSIALTEDGSRFYEAARSAIDAFHSAEAAAKGSRAVEGTLRIGCPVSFAQIQIVPRLTAFLDMFPGLSVDLVMSDAFLDPVEQGVDVAIRIGHLSDSALKARKVGVTRRVTVASPTYVERYGAPDHPKSLSEHNCVLYTHLTTGPEWPFLTETGPISVRVKGRVMADNSTAMRGAIVSGLGIGLCPLWLVGDALETGELVQLLAQFEPEPLPIHIVSPQRRFTPPKVTAFTNFIAESFKRDPAVAI